MKKVIIAGAGISGLVAGVYAQKAGHETIILEKGSSVGGLSTSWERKGYNIEGGMHWLTGSSLKPLIKFWKEVGALQENNPITNFDPMISVVHEGNPSLSFYRDRKRLKKDITERSPKDKRAARRLSKDIFLFEQLLTGSPKFYLHLIPFAVRTVALYRISAEKYTSRLHEADARLLTGSVICPRHNALSLIYEMASFCVGDGGFPEGGSKRMAQNIAEEFQRLGGKIIFNSEVENIIKENGRVKGVICNNAQIPCDDVIITSDTRKAIDQLDIHERWAERLRRNVIPLECMFIAFGIKTTLDEYSYSMRIPCSLDAGGMHHDYLMLYNYSQIKGSAPEGCTVLSCIIHGDTYDYWKNLSKEDYEKEKARISAEVQQTIEQELPKTKGKTEVLDMTTPLTYEKWSGCYKGSWMTVWKERVLPPFVPAECRKTKGLHFAGQKTMLSGGLPIALQSGRAAARKIKR